MKPTLQWERLPDESTKAYDAFCTYRSMKPNERSIAAAIAKVGGKPGLSRSWERWASANQWRSRAGAWDAHLQGLMDRAQESTVQEMAKRHAAIGQNLQLVSDVVMKEWVRRIKSGQVAIDEVPVDVLSRITKEAAQTAKVGVDLELRASGHEDGVGAHFKVTMTDEGRRQLADLFGDDSDD